MSFEEKLEKIKDICCEHIKKCNNPCFLCNKKCSYDKIITIINESEE